MSGQIQRAVTVGDLSLRIVGDLVEVDIEVGRGHGSVSASVPLCELHAALDYLVSETHS